MPKLSSSNPICKALRYSVSPRILIVGIFLMSVAHSQPEPDARSEAHSQSEVAVLSKVSARSESSANVPRVPASLAVNPPVATQANKSTSNAVTPTLAHQDWFNIAVELNSGEDQAKIAAAQLQKLPRPELVTAVRNWLHSYEGDVQSVGFSAVIALELRELKAELIRNAAVSDAWRLYHALNSISVDSDRTTITAVYIRRLAAPIPAAAAMAIIDGLTGYKTALPPVLFRKLQKSASYQVRETAVQNFMVTRTALSQGEQVERMRSSLLIKPYEVRLSAYKYFQTLPENDRKLLAPALSSDACRRETNDQVKAVCAQLVDLKSKAAGK